MDPITFSIIRHRLFRVVDEAVPTNSQQRQASDYLCSDDQHSPIKGPQ